MKYKKQVEIYYTGQVHGSVFSEDGRQVGLYMGDATDWWRPFKHDPARIEKAAEKVHEWADNLIAVCERQECGHEVSL